MNSKETKEKDSNPKKQDEGLLGFLKTFGLAAIFAITIRSFLYEPFHIPSSSMKPGLLIGDYIFVSKLSYGYSKYSFPFSSLHLFDKRFFEDTPKRGDVAVFRLPSDTDINYIKRIIGLPGDIIKVTNGQLFINNEAIEKNFVDDFIDDDGTNIPIFVEKIDGRNVLVLDQYKNIPQDNTGNYKVPKDHFFVMGDNRDNSQDSRFQMQVGFIPKNNLVGRATLIFFSSKYPIWKLWKIHKSIRFDRIIKKIE
jgi:signal peptidase I